MSYKFSTGSVFQGDIYFEDDRRGARTWIDFGHDTITLRPSGSAILYTEATKVGIGTTSPMEVLHVAGNVKAVGDDVRIKIDGATDSHPGLELYENGTRKWIVFNDYTTDNLTFKTNSDTRMSIEQGGNVGVGTTSPKTTLDVHHDPTSLANDTGGGEVVTFGAGPSGGSTTAGKLYYLDTDGQWEEADADAIASSGVLLAIALGTSPSTHGMLLRGFFDVHSYFIGTFNEGVGFCTTTANVIYFNPSNNTLELT